MFEKEKITPLDVAWVMAVKESAEFFYQDMCKSMLFDNVQQLRNHLMNLTHKEQGFFIECGVCGGNSINAMADILTKLGSNNKFVGFDSFHGLCEDWTGTPYTANAVTRNGNLPEVRSNVELIPGRVETTIPAFFQNRARNISFLHLDMDTYSPTLFVLEHLRPKLVKGSVILFDELYGYPGWKNHEWRALNEVFDREEYKFIGFSSVAAAIRLL